MDAIYVTLIDHVIQGVINVSLAAIAATPAIIFALAKLREVRRITQEASMKADTAAEAAKVAAENAVRTAQIAKQNKDALAAKFEHAMDSQTAELKEAIKHNGHGPVQ